MYGKVTSPAPAVTRIADIPQRDGGEQGRTLTASGVAEFADAGMGFTGRRQQVLTSGVHIAGGSE